MRRSKLLQWLLTIKVCYAIGGGYLADSIIGGFVAGSILIGNYWLVLIVVTARAFVGGILIWRGIPQKENEITIKLTNPYLDRMLKKHGSGNH